MVLLMLVGSTTFANNLSAQDAIAGYKIQACDVYSQVESKLKPFLSVSQTKYEKNADGSLKVITRMVLNTALYNAMKDFVEICSGFVQVRSIGQIVNPLNRIRNNIWDGQVQVTLSRILNQGFEIWYQIL